MRKSVPQKSVWESIWHNNCTVKSIFIVACSNGIVYNLDMSAFNCEDIRQLEVQQDETG